MNFLLTTYIYPIKKRIPLSKVMGLSLDNPRTDEEIELIKTNLNVSLNSPDEMYHFQNHFRLPINTTEELVGYTTVENILIEFFNVTEDDYVKTFDNDDEVLTKLSKMWIILRFDDEGEIVRLKEAQKELVREGEGRYFTLLGDNNPIVRNSQNALSFSYLLSLLLHTEKEEYFGRCFILSNNTDRIRMPQIDRFLNQTIFYFACSIFAPNPNDKSIWFISHQYTIKSLLKICSNLDRLIVDEITKQKLLYVSELLQHASSIGDYKIKVVILVSILELLLTHSPDFNRYNVEDSINKQFQLKASLLVYRNDKTKDLEEIKSKLKVIYSVRSNIAHGNFEALNKWINKEFEKILKSDEEAIMWGKSMVLSEIVSDLYTFLRAVLEEYIKDKTFVEFLKNN